MLYSGRKNTIFRRQQLQGYYGKPWHFDIEHEEDFLENIAEIPYDSVLVSEYLSVLKPLDFEICVTGHAGIITKKELFSSF